MGKIEKYSSAEQVSGAPKGSTENHYTMEEYESLLDKGIWPGGYVEGLGYVIKEVVVKPSGHTSGESFWGSLYDSFSSWIGSMFGSDETYDENMHPNYDENTSNGSTYANPYPQGPKTYKERAYLHSLAEGIGINACFDYDCGVNISGYKMSASASVNPMNFRGRDFFACVKVIVNGSEFVYPMSHNIGGSITQYGYTSLGFCDIELPKVRGARVILYIGFMYDSGIGWSSGKHEITVH